MYKESRDRWYTGTYSDESVYGKHGFTTWVPEVTMWVKGEEEDGDYFEIGVNRIKEAFK